MRKFINSIAAAGARDGRDDRWERDGDRDRD